MIISFVGFTRKENSPSKFVKVPIVVSFIRTLAITGVPFETTFPSKVAF
jgi:hypothetical protein